MASGEDNMEKALKAFVIFVIALVVGGGAAIFGIAYYFVRHTAGHS